MKKKNFSLNSVISIRTYRELIARKDLIEARKPHVAIQYRLAVLQKQQSRNTVALQNELTQFIHQKDTNTSTSLFTKQMQVTTEQDILYMLSSMSNYAKCIQSLQNKAKTLKEEIKPVYDNYMVAKNKLETICILQRNVHKKEKKREEKIRLAKLMEMIHC